MLKKKYTMIILILLLVLVLFGLLTTQFLAGNYAVTGKKLSSWNGKYVIGVPRNWDSCDAPSSYTLISAKTSREDMYLLVSLDSYDYGPDMTLDSFVNNYLIYIAGNSDVAEETKMETLPETVTIDGITGYYYEYTALSDGMQLRLFCYAAQTDDGYLTIQIASNEAAADENRKMAKAIIASLRVNQEQETTAEATPPETADAGEAAGDEAAGDASAGESEEADTEEEGVPSAGSGGDL